MWHFRTFFFCPVNIVANTASMSLFFGGLIIKNHIWRKNHIWYKNRIFNCRWNKKIVGVSHKSIIFNKTHKPIKLGTYIANKYKYEREEENEKGFNRQKSIS